MTKIISLLIAVIPLFRDLLKRYDAWKKERKRVKIEKERKKLLEANSADDFSDIFNGRL